MLRIGRVSYLNTLPVFYRWDTSSIELVEGHPSELVNRLRRGEVQAGIVSSVEFLLHPEDYRVVPGVCVASREKACSVLLFSSMPPEHIKTLYLTPASMTSRVLALHVLREVYCREPEISEDRERADALMLIGDEALREKSSGRWQYVYDLGEEWFRLHRLPFVFALFLVRKEAPPWLDRFIEEQCRRSKEDFYRDLKEGRVEGYDCKDIRDYFTLCLDYELDQRGWQSLEIFRKILLKKGYTI